MNFEKPSFTTVIEHGNTLVFISSMLLANRLAMAMLQACPSPVDMVIRIDDRVNLEAAMTFLREPGISSRLVIAHPAMAAHGWRAPFDRLIWIGDMPAVGTSQFALHAQAMARGDMPWGTPAKLRYDEKELFL